MKILNLYAGLGGNRKLWGNEHDITAVEIDPVIAQIYKALYPDDKVIVGDAHEYLRQHFREFDFIWASPPCPTHSVLQMTRYYDEKLKYPDMTLYQEILFLKANAECKWVVENVSPYYKPLIEPNIKLQRHLFWSNFEIPSHIFETDKIRTAQIADLEKMYGFNLKDYKLKNKRQILRNCVKPELGKYILDIISKAKGI